MNTETKGHYTMGQGVILPRWASFIVGTFGVAALVGMFWSGTISARLSTDIAHLSVAVSGLRVELTEQRKSSGDALFIAQKECLARHFGVLEVIRSLTDRLSRMEGK